MAATPPRRGEVRPPSDLPDLVGSPLWLEVEGADRKVYRATSAAVGGGGQNTFNSYTAAQLPLDTATQFADLKGKTTTVVGSVAITADPASPTGSSAEFSGAGGRIAIAGSNNDFDFGFGPFGIEGWFQTSQAAQQYTTLLDRAIGSTGGYTIIINNGSSADGKIALYQNAASLVVETGIGGFNDGQRHHLAVVRNGTQFYIFVDGVMRGFNQYVSFDVWALSVNALWLGNSTIASRAFIGRLDNWRIVKGIPTYAVSPFTVPVPPFPAAA